LYGHVPCVRRGRARRRGDRARLSAVPLPIRSSDPQGGRDMKLQKITPFLWFDHQAEEAAKFYVSVFKDSKMGQVSRYGEGMPLPKGTVMTAAFEIEGQSFVALNGGPQFRFTEAVSFVVNCET